MSEVKRSSIGLGTSWAYEACTGGLGAAGRHRYSVRSASCVMEGVLVSAKRESSPL
jgi:hypothetical protein